MPHPLPPDNRDAIRQAYCQVWRKHRTQTALEPLEQLILDVILEHPEYQALLADEERAMATDFLPEAGETNPFLHMGMHIAIREQLGCDRPAGIRALYQQLLIKKGDAHRVEHDMMECLGHALWQAQRNQATPDDTDYLNCLRTLVS